MRENVVMDFLIRVGATSPSIKINYHNINKKSPVVIWISNDSPTGERSVGSEPISQRFPARVPRS